MLCNGQGYILALANNPKEAKPSSLRDIPTVTGMLFGWLVQLNPEQHLESCHPQDKGEITSVKG